MWLPSTIQYTCTPLVPYLRIKNNTVDWSLAAYCVPYKAAQSHLKVNNREGYTQSSIARSNQLTTIVQRIAKFKCQCVGPNTHKTDGRWRWRIREWRPLTGRHSVGRSPTYMIDRWPGEGCGRPQDASCSTPFVVAIFRGGLCPAVDIFRLKRWWWYAFWFPLK